MANRSDVIVVGAGLGGLAAAATLARAGRHVRVFERHVQPGGYATTFCRGGYEFEVSLHALSGVGRPGQPGPLQRLLEELGVASLVELLPIAPLYRSVAPGLDLRIPVGVDAAYEALAERFPAERAGLARVLAELVAIGEQADQAGAGGHLPSTLEALTRYPKLAHAALVTLGSLLDRELTDPLARLALGQLWGYFGVPPSRCSLLYAAVGISGYLRWGACYPRGKSQSLSNALARVVEEAGSTVTLGCGVRRIVVEGGRVAGVITDDGQRWDAPVVVSNASPQITCLELLGAEQVPAAYLRRLAVQEPSLGSLCVYLGLDADHEALGLTDHEVFVNVSADMDAHYRSYLRPEPPEAFLMGCYDATVPGFSPPGRSTVVLVSLADGAAWARLPPTEYLATKTRLAEHLVGEAEKLFPGMSDHIAVAVVSTPITNMRYTGHPGGAIYGFANVPAQNPGWRLEQRGPVPGLWLAGAWTRPGGGYQPCMMSGHGAARAILATRQHGR